MPRELGAILLCLLCTAYLLVFWRRLLIDGLVPCDGGMMRIVFPAWTIGNRLFSGALFPLWDSYRNMGCPFLAHPPNQVLYPLHRFFPVTHFLDYLRLYVVGHVLLAAVPSFLLARRWGWSAFAGALAALAVCCNGFVLARVTTTIDFAAYAWAPLALYALAQRKPMGLALVLAFQWFAGLPTFSLMTGLLLIIAAAADEDPRAAVRCLLVGGVTGAALAAVQVLPFIDLLRQSARPVLLSPEDAMEFGLHPKELIRPLVVPALFLARMSPVTASDPAVVGFYIGPVLAALAVVSAALGGRRERVFAGATLVFFALTLGSRLPFYQFIPGITVFRFPAHWLFPAVIFTAFTAASAVDRLRVPAARAAVVVIVALDLLIYAWPAHVAWAEPAVLEEKPQLLSMLGPEIPAGRVFFEPELINLSSQWKMSTITDWENMVRIGLPSIAAGYGVREVVSLHQLPVYTHVNLVRRLASLQPDDPAFDYAGVSTIVRLSAVVAGVTPPQSFQVTTNPNAKAAVFFVDSGRVTQIQTRAETVAVEVEGPGRLVLSESYDRGWRAWIDGAEKETEVFEAAFPSVMVPAGRHLVRFRYRPTCFLVGAGVSFAALAGLLVFCLGGFKWIIRAYARMRIGNTKNTGS